MLKIFDIKKQEWVVFLSCLALASLLFSPFLLTLSMILLLLSAFVDSSNSNLYKFVFRKNFKVITGKNLQNKAFLAVSLSFFLVFLSGLWSEDSAYWADRLRIRLPFLVLPIAFAFLPALSQRLYYFCLYFLLALLSFSMIGVLTNYALHFEHINETLLHGKNIPVPMNHIRYSLLLAFTILASVFLWQKNYYWKYGVERKFIATMSLFLFIGIHILTVRSGLVCLYSGIVLLSLRYIWQTKRFALLFALVFFVSAIPTAAYLLMPSVHKKIEYALYDWQQFQSGNGKDYSDSERWGSMLAGWKVGNAHPWLGCGYGDLKKEVNAAYQEVFPLEKEPKIPHNQYLMTFAGVGIVGLIVFLFALFFPIFYRKNYQEPIFLSLNVIVLFSFLVESTIETQAGTAIFALLLCLGLNHKNAQ